jgi:glutamate formiminotransferase
MVAWNVWLQGATLDATNAIATSIRGAAVRALGFQVTGATQVSCNLLEPSTVTPKDVYARIEGCLADEAHVVRCELVGLVPSAVLAAVPEDWWSRLDLSEDRAVEVRAAAAGLGAR